LILDSAGIPEIQDMNVVPNLADALDTPLTLFEA
jgi:hypothetical protein